MPVPVDVGALLPPPRAWTFLRRPGEQGFALPEHCRLRAFTARAEVSPSTRFFADPRAMATLVVADAAGSPPHLTGVAAVSLDPEGLARATAALPWLDATEPPKLAKGGSTWVAALERPGAAGATGVALWHDGTAELLGEGDGFAAADLVCAEAAPDAGSAPGCALLTTRLARVAQPGATVWIGAAGAPAHAWKPVEIVPSASDGEARPLGIAAFEAGAGRVEVTVALVDSGEVVFHRVDGAGGREEARLPAARGVLDVLALPAPVAMTTTSGADEEGCPRDGPLGLRFARAGDAGAAASGDGGAPPPEIAAPAPPLRGELRRLSRGALALWSAPLGCRHTRRVVYAVVLDARGAPAGAPLPMGDAAAFAAASQGDDVDLYLQDPVSVAWLRMTCTAP